MLLKNILVALDGSLASERALPYAVELAYAAGAALTLVRTAGVHPRLHLGLAHLLPQDPSRYLNIHAYRLRAQGLLVHTAVAPGKPRGALVAEIERRQPDLVVMSTQRRSGTDRLMHSGVTDTVVSHVGCPVMLVQAQANTGVSAAPRLAGKRILVPLDGTRSSEASLPVAVYFARTLGSEVLLVRAIIPPDPLPTDLELFAPSELDQALALADAEDAATEYLHRLAFSLSISEDGVRVSGLARVGQLAEVIRELSTTAHGQHDSPIGLVVPPMRTRSRLTGAILGGEVDVAVGGDDLPVVLVHPQISSSAPEVENTLATTIQGVAPLPVGAFIRHTVSTFK